MTLTGPSPLVSAAATFLNDLGLLRFARSPTAAFLGLQNDFDAHLARAPYLNISLAPAKAALIHLVPVFSNEATRLAPTPVSLGPLLIVPSGTIKILGVLVDDRFTFTSHVNSVASWLSQITIRLKCIARAKDLSPPAMHHVATITAIATMLWGSSTWWNGTQAILNRLLLAHHSLALAVCQAKSFTRRASLYCDSGLALLDLLFNQASQSYSIHILFYQPVHLITHRLFEAMRAAPGLVYPQGTGLAGTTALLLPLNIGPRVGPSHSPWLNRLSTPCLAALKRAPTDNLLRLWKAHYPCGNASP